MIQVGMLDVVAARSAMARSSSTEALLPRGAEDSRSALAELP
jgi:hypothetical protein